MIYLLVHVSCSSSYGLEFSYHLWEYFTMEPFKGSFSFFLANSYNQKSINGKTKHLEECFYSLLFLKYPLIVYTKRRKKSIRKKKYWWWWHNYQLVTLQHLIYFQFWDFDYIFAKLSVTPCFNYAFLFSNTAHMK